MKALREIGIKKTIRYIFYTIWYVFFRLSLFSPIRVIMLELAGAKIGKNTIINNIALFNLYRTGLSGLSIGKNCFLGDEVMLDLAGEIIIRDNTTLSNRVLVLTHVNVGYKDHPLQKFIKKMVGKVVFQNGSFVGAGAIILPNVKTGQGGAVAAGSVVKDDVDDWTLVGGIPAKYLKKFKI